MNIGEESPGEFADKLKTLRAWTCRTFSLVVQFRTTFALGIVSFDYALLVAILPSWLPARS